MRTVRTPSPTETATLRTTGLRHGFTLRHLFQPDQVELVLTDLDRAIVGSACPVDFPLSLPVPEELRAVAFCERRELGIINLGGAGSVTVGAVIYDLAPRTCLYVGRGTEPISFATADPAEPAAFFFVSYPAHAIHPTSRVTQAEAHVLSLGSKAEANERTLYQYIHPGGVPSCQLVMGYTELAPGSVWNTMPCHTHDRRSEIYCYFDVPEHHAVLHLMGEPAETRPLWVGNRQVVLSPSWSVHAGAGTANYRFVWAMGGENQHFDDMDKIAIADLR